MEISRIRALRGPNLWTRRTAIEAIVTLSEGERPLSGMLGFEDRLRERFPALGFLRATRNTDTLTLAHALEVAAICLQAQAGCPVTFSRTAKTVQPVMKTKPVPQQVSHQQQHLITNQVSE